MTSHESDAHDATEAEAALALSNEPKSRELFAHYARLGLTDTQLADVFGVPEAELVQMYDALLQKSRALRRADLLQSLSDHAKRGNETALQWAIEVVGGLNDD